MNRLAKKIKLYQSLFHLIQCLIEIMHGYKKFYQGNDKVTQLLMVFVQKLPFYHSIYTGKDAPPISKGCTLFTYDENLLPLFDQLTKLGHKGSWISYFIDNGRGTSIKVFYINKTDTRNEKKLNDAFNLRLTKKLATGTGYYDYRKRNSKKFWESRMLLYQIKPALQKNLQEIDDSKTHKSTGRLAVPIISKIIEEYLDLPEESDAFVLKL